MPQESENILVVVKNLLQFHVFFVLWRELSNRGAYPRAWDSPLKQKQILETPLSVHLREKKINVHGVLNVRKLYLLHSTENAKNGIIYQALRYSLPYASGLANVRVVFFTVFPQLQALILLTVLLELALTNRPSIKCSPTLGHCTYCPIVPQTVDVFKLLVPRTIQPRFYSLYCQ